MEGGPWCLKLSSPVPGGSGMMGDEAQLLPAPTLPPALCGLEALGLVSGPVLQISSVADLEALLRTGDIESLRSFSGQ